MKEKDFQELKKRLCVETVRPDVWALIEHADKLRTRVVRAIDDRDDWDKDEPLLGYEAGPLLPADENFEALADRLGP